MDNQTAANKDHYTNHLAGVNEINLVRATEDIHNAQGQLLLPAGSTLDSKATSRIIKFKLLKPLEESVAIDGQLTETSLYDDFNDFFQSDSGLSELWQKNNNDEPFRALIANLSAHRVLLQKLTVVKLRFPKLYQEALFCAWVSQHIYQQQGKDTCLDMFTAALLHDIGLLHIDPNLHDEEARTSPEQWRQWHSHPLISQQILANTEGISPICSKAAAQHHEALDATGYPAGLISKQISPEAQLLFLLDEVWTLYQRWFKPRGRSLHDLLPALQMNQNFRNNSDAASLMQLLKQIPETAHCFTPPPLMDSLIEHVINKYHYVENFLLMTGHLNKQLGYQHGEKKLLGLQNILLHIHVSITRSGMINSAYMRWLEQVREQKLAYAYRELEDVSLMLSIIGSYCQRFQLALNNYNQQCADNTLLALQASLNELHKPCLATALQEQCMELA